MNVDTLGDELVSMRLRAEAAEARVAELTARVGELEALNEKMAKLALSAAKKLVYFSDVLDQFTDGQKARRLLGDLEKEARQALAGLSDEAKSGSPAPVGEADSLDPALARQAQKQALRDVSKVIVDPVKEAERAVIKTSMVFWDIRTDSAKFAWEAACDILVEMENGRNYFGKQEAEQAVVEVAEAWRNAPAGISMIDYTDRLIAAIDAYVEAREAGGEAKPCALTFCKSGLTATRSASDSHDDGCWNTSICEQCFHILGLDRDGAELPGNGDELLKAYYP